MPSKLDSARVRANVRKLGGDFSKRARAGLLRVGKRVKETAVENAPERDGILRGSAELIVSKEGRSVTVVFTAEHAIAVHENPSKHDPPSWEGKTIVFNPPGTGQKFLQKAWLAETGGSMMEDIAKEMKVR
jgi:hypothetical protein